MGKHLKNGIVQKENNASVWQLRFFDPTITQVITTKQAYDFVVKDMEQAHWLSI